MPDKLEKCQTVLVVEVVMVIVIVIVVLVVVVVVVIVIVIVVLVGRAKRAPHWGVQSRFRVVCRSVCMYVCRMSNHVESRESNTRMLKVSIGR